VPLWQVSGLARRLHDSPNLQEAFEKHIAAKRTGPLAGDDKSSKTCISRRVPTRWNSDFLCLESYVNLKSYIRSFVADPDHSLGAYTLTQKQWELATTLTDVLIVRQLKVHTTTT